MDNSDRFVDLRQNVDKIWEVINYYRKEMRVELYLPENIKEWCDMYGARDGIYEDMSHRLGKIYSTRTTIRLLLRAKIYEDDINQIPYFAFRLPENRPKLRDFILHLILHEIAHALDDGPKSEEECDRWAESQMVHFKDIEFV